MVKINRVILRVAVVVAAIIGLLNLADGIYAGIAVDAATSGLTMAATIEPSMTLTLSDSSKILNVIPTSSGSFNSTSITVGAYSNGRIGYTLTMTPEHTALTGSGINTIPTLTANSTCTGGSTCNSSNFTAGRWGIAVGDGVYGPAAATNLVTVANTTATVASNTYTIYLGANLDLSTPTDNYSTTLNFALTSSTVAAYDVTFNYDSNISSLAVRDLSGNTLTPTTSSTGTATYSLDYANTYTLTPTYVSGYEFNTVSLTGAGYLMEDSLTFVAGAGVSTVSVASTKELCAPAGTLYCNVADMSKGTQTTADLQATITTPTSADRTQDTSNSGVYEYNSSAFGTASDADSTSTIYYYRGVLENTVGSYGSDGSAVTYPNYVILDADGDRTTSDTCWRIVRTTGSGGVKMIYNGLWTGSTCANATTSAQASATSAFNSSDNSIVYVGYTYNSNYINNANTNGVSTDLVLGSGSTPTTNDTRSTIKEYIEDTWYPANLSAYTSILEGNAGYCNDRSYYGTTTGTTLGEIQPTISTSGTVYFGARNRDFVNDSVGPTLGCTRGDVDLYRYVSGNTNYTSNFLKYPVALLTADEAALAGSGRSSGNPTTYNAKSFLGSGSNFWLLSPYNRDSDGDAYGFVLYSSGDLNGNYVSTMRGVRPAISLRSGTTVSSGSGIATDPWVVTAP